MAEEINGQDASSLTQSIASTSPEFSVRSRASGLQKNDDDDVIDAPNRVQTCTGFPPLWSGLRGGQNWVSGWKGMHRKDLEKSLVLESFFFFLSEELDLT